MDDTFLKPTTLPPEVLAAAQTLEAWRAKASQQERADLAAATGVAGGDLARSYPHGFAVTEAYRDSLPDLQNGPASLIQGAKTRIQHVGISNFRVPVRYALRDGGTQTLETSVSGTVSLEADQKGINMSRIMRSFYDQMDQAFCFNALDASVRAYLRDLGSDEARIQLHFSYPMRVQSLRSGLSGFQYYDLTLESQCRAKGARRMMHLDYVYSSTCPCSLELSEHARSARGQLATPHSQRSVARLSLVLQPGQTLWPEDLIEVCRSAVPTETQVMVKREDEQAFAELNAANPIFVEDAARLFAQALAADARIGDFRVVASHQESLHSHDAVSVLVQGETFADQPIEPRLFASMLHASRA